MNTFPYKRIVVIGTTSSGKSTLAKQIADKFDYQFIELDALNWEENWEQAENNIFRERVRQAISSEMWSLAGNYNVTRDLVWSRAEAIIWLDYPFHIVFWRLIKRSIHRAITKELLWGKNIERGWVHLKLWSPDSLIHWLFKTYWRRRRETPVLLQQYPHLKLIHFKHPQEAEEWIKNL